MKTPIHRFAIGLAAACLLATPAVAQEEEEVPVPASLDELKQLVTEVVEENDVPAVGIALVDAGGPLWIAGIGKADLENDLDATAETIFRIGSTSKMFVSLAVLKLVEEGELSLDDRLAELAPEIEFENRWEETDPIRVVHLLEHTTGWDDIHLPEYAHSVYPPVSLKEGLDFHPHSRASRWKPGSRMSYCNAGPPVAAYIVEKVSGQDFEQYVRNTFFTPMGMETMTYRRTDDVLEHGATLYQNGNQPQDYWHIIMRPSGSINASPRDVARFLQFYVNRGVVDGEPLVSQASLLRMESVGSTGAAQAGQTAGYGLGNYSSSHEHWVYRAHNGGVNGGITDFAYLPEAGVGYAVMINSDDVASIVKVVELVRNFQTRELEPPEVPAPTDVTAEHEAVEGLYYPINPRQQISYFIDRVFGVQRLWLDEGRLQRKPLLGGDASAYIPVSTTLYASEETGVTALSRVEDPLAGPVVHAGTVVLKPASSLLVYGQLAVVVFWGVAIVTSFVFFPIWAIRRLLKKIEPGAAVLIRVWPLLAGISVVAFITAFGMGMDDPFAKLGSPTFWSVTIMLSTIAFAVFAALGVNAAISHRRTPMNRVNYWYSTISSVIHLAVVLYLLWFGVIALRTWA